MQSTTEELSAGLGTSPNQNRNKNRTETNNEKSETINQIAVLIAIYTYTNPKERRNKRMTPTILASGAGASIDSSVITELINLCKQVMGLFSEFPLNIFFVSSLVGVGFMIFRQAKGAAKS